MLCLIHRDPFKRQYTLPPKYDLFFTVQRLKLRKGHALNIGLWPHPKTLFVNTLIIPKLIDIVM